MAIAPKGRPTMKVVAEHAGVSVATVSYVLSGRIGGSGVSEATAAAAPMGLRTLVLADGDWEDLLDGYPVDVAFVDGAGTEHRARLVALARRGLRLVVFSDDLEPEGYDVIRSPALPGCELAVQHLLGQHTTIGCLAGGSPDRPSTRLEPYRRLLGEAGIAPRDGDVQFFSHDASSAFGAALRLLDRPDRPSAVYATTDFAAIAAVNAAHRHDHPWTLHLRESTHLDQTGSPR